MEHEVVWLIVERRFAFLMQRDAYCSVIFWYEGRNKIEMVVDNDDYELWEEHAIDYESD